MGRFKALRSHLPHLSFFPPFSPGSDLVWENRGDRQHAKPRLCQEVHPGLLLWGEAEPALWRVSYSVWSGPLRTHTEVCAFQICRPLHARSSNSPILPFVSTTGLTSSPSFTLLRPPSISSSPLPFSVSHFLAPSSSLFPPLPPARLPPEE